MKLIESDEKYVTQIAEYRKEFIDSNDSMDGCGMLSKIEDPIEWIRKTRELTNKFTIPNGFVQCTQFLCIREDDDKLVGMIQVRHYFTEFLEKYGGHIGYSVRPCERRKGYANFMLSSCLPYCKKIGLKKVLLTCKVSNVGSRKTILKNGGIYENNVFCEEDKCELERYWIML